MDVKFSRDPKARNAALSVLLVLKLMPLYLEIKTNLSKSLIESVKNDGSSSGPIFYFEESSNFF